MGEWLSDFQTRSTKGMELARAPILVGLVIYVIVSLTTIFGVLPVGSSVLVAALAGPTVLARVAMLSGIVFVWFLYLIGTVATASFFVSLIKSKSHVGCILWAIVLFGFWTASGIGSQHLLFLLALGEDLPTDLWPFW